MPQEGNGFTTQETGEMLQFIVANMATKADIEIVVAKAKNEIMGYVDKKDREYRGEFNLALRKEDEKTDALIDELSDIETIDSDTASELKNLSPFYRKAA